MTEQSNTARPLPVVDRAKRLQLLDAGGAVKARLAAAQRAARKRRGLTQKEIAYACGLDQPNVCRSEDAADPMTLNMRHIVMLATTPLTRAFGLDVFGKLEAEVRPAADVHGENDAARLASLTVETSDPVRALAVAMADGDLTVGELETLERECGEAIAALQEARARFSALLQARRAREGERA